MGFKDHFSGHAQIYAAARPDYPPELFTWLAGISPRRGLAWDCATGNGQAALGLARHFQRVIATDASAAQLQAATPHESVDYRCQPAEQPLAEAGQVDLVTVAQALHWLERDAFYANADRALGTDGVLAVWCYGRQSVNAAVDPVIDYLYADILGPHWPPDRLHVESGYANLEFPYPELPAPALHMERHWTLDQQLAYLRSWSATQRYLQAKGQDPIMLVMEELGAAWGGDDPHIRQTIRWPLALRVGRKLRSP
ncbi:MAG: putative methyltransferase YcgJ [Pseudomonadota bacterium]|jgi:SAM-dependent methyltransferase